MSVPISRKPVNNNLSIQYYPHYKGVPGRLAGHQADIIDNSFERPQICLAKTLSIYWVTLHEAHNFFHSPIMNDINLYFRLILCWKY